MTHRDGEVRWLSASVFPVRETGDRVNHVQIVLRDITEQRQRDERQRAQTALLEERGRLLSAFQAIGTATLQSLDLDEVLDTLTDQVMRTGIFRSLTVPTVDHAKRIVEVKRNYLSAVGEYADGQVGSVEAGGQSVSSPHRKAVFIFMLSELWGAGTTSKTTTPSQPLRAQVN